MISGIVNDSIGQDLDYWRVARPTKIWFAHGSTYRRPELEMRRNQPTCLEDRPRNRLQLDCLTATGFFFLFEPSLSVPMLLLFWVSESWADSSASGCSSTSLSSPPAASLVELNTRSKMAKANRPAMRHRPSRTWSFGAFFPPVSSFNNSIDRSNISIIFFMFLKFFLYSLVPFNQRLGCLDLFTSFASSNSHVFLNLEIIWLYL